MKLYYKFSHPNPSVSSLPHDLSVQKSIYSLTLNTVLFLILTVATLDGVILEVGNCTINFLLNIKSLQDENHKLILLKNDVKQNIDTTRIEVKSPTTRAHRWLEKLKILNVKLRKLWLQQVRWITATCALNTNLAEA